MEKEQFIKEKMKKLVGEEKYSRLQAFAIANSMYNKMQQGGGSFDPLGMQFNPMSYSTINGLPIGNAIQRASKQYNLDPFEAQNLIYNKSEDTANYPTFYNNFKNYTESEEDNTEETVKKNPFGSRFDPINSQFDPMGLRGMNSSLNATNAYGIDTTPIKSAGIYKDWDKNNDGLPDLSEIDTQEKRKKTADNNRVNILNPDGELSMGYALNFAGRGFGAKNPYQAGIGTALSLVKGARNFMSGFAEGKEDLRVAKEMQDRQFDKQRNYVWSQQGGRIKNSDVIAQNAITDEGQGNVNMEGGEYVLRNSGQVQPVVGDRHIERGEIADGVNANLQNGDKVISDYLKLKPKDIKELKDRYNITVKKGVTFAQAQKQTDKVIGLKKLEEEKATVLEKIEKVQNIKDKTTKELSLNSLLKSFGTINEKINTLSGVREEVADFIFTLQERQPKKDTSKLYDKNGKAVEETQDNIVQQGGEMYIAQLAKKHNIPLERAMELMKMQQGGEQNQMPQEQGGQEEQIMQMIVQMLQQGASSEQVVQTLVEQGVPQEVVVGMIEQVMQGGEQNQMPQEGNPDQIMQMVAEALQSGAQPEEVVQELTDILYESVKNLPEEEALSELKKIGIIK